MDVVNGDEARKLLLAASNRRSYSRVPAVANYSVISEHRVVERKVTAYQSVIQPNPVIQDTLFMTPRNNYKTSDRHSEYAVQELDDAGYPRFVLENPYNDIDKRSNLNHNVASHRNTVMQPGAIMYI